jgi:CheY-like chemotaxis protein
MINEPTTILYIDDDPDDLLIFGESIANLYPLITILKAQSGEEGIAVLNGLEEENKPFPSLIMLDMNMPKMNGKQCLRKLKAMKQLAAVPVIIYSTSKLEEDRHDTRQLGATAFFTKPSSLDKLVETIRLVLTHQWQHVDKDIFFVK